MKNNKKYDRSSKPITPVKNTPINKLKKPENLRKNIYSYGKAEEVSAAIIIQNWYRTKFIHKIPIKSNSNIKEKEEIPKTFSELENYLENVGIEMNNILENFGKENAQDLSKMPDPEQILLQLKSKLSSKTLEIQNQSNLIKICKTN